MEEEKNVNENKAVKMQKSALLYIAHLLTTLDVKLLALHRTPTSAAAGN